MEFEKDILAALEKSPKVTKEAKLKLYDTKDGFKIYADDASINTVFGGTIDIKNEVSTIKTVKVPTLDGGTEEKKIQSTNVNKGFIECFEARVTSAKPETAQGIVKIWNSVKKDFEINFLRHDRWKTIFKGLWVTIKLTFCALIIGIILGFIVAFVRCTYLKNTKHGFVLKILNAICQFYLTIIRGTPAVVQIMIIYFVIFMPLGVDKFIAAVVCFGFNSGAYVAEIVRGGIMSVDDGQIEAGRSLGFNYMQTMLYIVFPQAFKAVLPALANEFVVLLKETSVAFYIGLGDLMYAGNAIRSATYSPFMPLVAVALIYLVMVLGLSRLVGILERRLRNNER
ncbi:MAG: amino acid ABC transporter permease [Clostridia bacterium]|nr:amino acid ABC transporter permease [Clostridia bacterium]